MAESERFELSNGFKAVTPLAGELLRPLGQLSKFTLLLLRFNVYLKYTLNKKLQSSCKLDTPLTGQHLRPFGHISSGCEY